jgi:hypothetical protein
MALDRDEFKKLTAAIFYAEKLNVMGTGYTPLKVVMNILSMYCKDTTAVIKTAKANGGDSFSLEWHYTNEQ